MGGDNNVSCQTFWAPGKQKDASSGWGAIVRTTADRNYLAQFGVRGSKPPIPPIPPAHIVVLSSLPSGALSKVLLAVYQGCFTASFANSNRVQGTYQRGATRDRRCRANADRAAATSLRSLAPLTAAISGLDRSSASSSASGSCNDGTFAARAALAISTRRDRRASGFLRRLLHCLTNGSRHPAVRPARRGAPPTWEEP